MGLFDSIAGQALGALSGAGGSGDGTPPGLMGVILSVVNNPQNGGIQGLVQAFQDKGLGGVIASWIGGGQNLPISAEQLQMVLGNEQVMSLAKQFGFEPQQLLGQLSQFLPQVVDKLSPAGTLPADQDGLGQAMGMLGGLFK